jgi:hypothetical protein
MSTSGESGEHMGAAGVIAKPFDPMRLAQQVFAIWNDLPPQAAVR